MCWLDILSCVSQGFLADISKAVNASELTTPWEEPPGDGAPAGRRTTMFASDESDSCHFSSSGQVRCTCFWGDEGTQESRICRCRGELDNWTLLNNGCLPPLLLFWILPTLKFTNKHVPQPSTPLWIIAFIPDWLRAWHCARHPGSVLLLGPYIRLYGQCFGIPIIQTAKLYYHSMHAVRTRIQFFFWFQSLFPMLLSHLMICFHSPITGLVLLF